jgi:membrane protein
MSKHASSRTDSPGPAGNRSEGHLEHELPATGPSPTGPSAGRTGSSLEREFPGATADEPKQIPGRGWLQVSKRAWAESKLDQIPLLAAGVAFYTFLSLFPAMIAAVTVYGLVADRETVAEQTEQLSAALPEAAAQIITEQMRAIAAQPEQSLGLGLVIALALALWSASGGVGNIITAVNVAYDEEETRGFVKRKALALGLTFGAIVFAAVSVGLIAVAPPLLDAFIPDGALRWLLEAARWVLLVGAVVVALAVLYTYAPDRNAPRFTWVSVGAAVATVIWLAASLGFSVYVDNFGSYSKTYGALAGVAVLMLWLWITAFIVLFGAEINAESEQQTVTDTTVGPAEPLGQRGAVKADNLPHQQPAEKKRG